MLPRGTRHKKNGGIVVWCLWGVSGYVEGAGDACPGAFHAMEVDPEENAGAAERVRRASLPQRNHLFVSICVIRVKSHLMFGGGDGSGG